MDLTMTFAVVLDVPGGTEQQYDQIAANVFPEGKLPDGWLLHVAGQIQNGWREVNIVSSREEFEAFSRERVEPATEKVGDPPAQVTFFPIHNLIRS